VRHRDIVLFMFISSPGRRP